MPEISVIICSHNPRPNYLRRALEALRHQNMAKTRWELLLVDNASTGSLAHLWDLSWHPSARHIHESELGLSAARRRGIIEASANLIVFVDDDNVLDAHYLSEAARIGRDLPSLGVWGSASIKPEFETPPAEYLKHYLSLLALRESETSRLSKVLPCIEATPWGPGLCVRAVVAKAYVDQAQRSNIQITGRKGNELLCAEDDEFSYVALRAGFIIGIFPELKVTHLIAKERVTEQYLAKLVEGGAVSHILIDYKWRQIVPRHQRSFRGFLSLLKNLIMNRGIDRRMGWARLRGIAKAQTIIANKGAPYDICK